MVYRPDIDERLCFVLMPFQDFHLQYFKGIIAPAAESLGLQAQKADDIYGTAPIIQDIWHAIWTAKVVIADVTARNPNVNYELGLCRAPGVPIEANRLIVQLFIVAYNCDDGDVKSAY